MPVLDTGADTDEEFGADLITAGDGSHEAVADVGFVGVIAVIDFQVGGGDGVAEIYHGAETFFGLGGCAESDYHAYQAQ